MATLIRKGAVSLGMAESLQALLALKGVLVLLLGWAILVGLRKAIPSPEPARIEKRAHSKHWSERWNTQDGTATIRDGFSYMNKRRLITVTTMKSENPFTVTNTNWGDGSPALMSW